MLKVYSRGCKFLYLVLKKPPFYFILADILVLFDRIFLSNPNPFTTFLFKYYPPIQSKKSGFWAQGIETCSHDCMVQVPSRKLYAWLKKILLFKNGVKYERTWKYESRLLDFLQSEPSPYLWKYLTQYVDQLISHKIRFHSPC